MKYSEKMSLLARVIIANFYEACLDFIEGRGSLRINFSMKTTIYSRAILITEYLFYGVFNFSLLLMMTLVWSRSVFLLINENVFY